MRRRGPASGAVDARRSRAHGSGMGVRGHGCGTGGHGAAAGGGGRRRRGLGAGGRAARTPGRPRGRPTQPAPDRAGAAAAGDPRAAAVGDQAGAALQLQLRRGDAISCRGRSRTSPTTTTRNYFLNPPAYSYLLNIVFELWFGSRRCGEPGVRGRPDRGVRGGAGGRRGARHARRCGSPTWRACGCSTAPSGWSPRRSSASRSCRSSTAIWRSTTSRRWPRWRCRCTGPRACCATAPGATT